MLPHPVFSRHVCHLTAGTLDENAINNDGDHPLLEPRIFSACSKVRNLRNNTTAAGEQ
jgi:hypothetical protein